VRLAPGFEFSPDALLKGRASVGVRRFKPVSGELPDYTGPVAAVELSFAPRETTRFDVKVDRDVQYSFEPLTPYYVATGGGVTVMQRLVGQFDVTGSFARHMLAYRAIEGAALDRDRRDNVNILGGGVGYHLSQGARIGFNVEYSERQSNDVLRREYDRLRMFGSVTYGFK
jgi:hypothetical protein